MLDSDLLETTERLRAARRLSRSDVINDALRIGLPAYEERLTALHAPVPRKAAS